MVVTCCEDCGFICEEYQLKKTKGSCPRCNPDDANKFHARRNAVREGREIPKEAI